MHCKTCKYPLWNMKERRCPECGAPFLISDFVFTPSAVQFRCPHCSQDYYGTDPQTGHLVPPEFACVRCGNTIGINDTIVLPTAGLTEAEAASERHPWIERSGSTLRAWGATAKSSCFSPGRLIRLAPASARGGQAVSFFLLTLAVSSLLSFGSLIAFVLAMQYGVSGPPVEAVGPVIAAWLICGGLIFGALWVWLLTAHAVMRLTGPTRDVRRTVLAMCYSSGPLVVSSVPCLGGYLLPIACLWWVVNAGFMLGQAHGARAWRGMVAAIALPGLITAFLTAWIGVRFT
ncbi:MAG: hypothetical protein GIKADHBN_01937 [Phycisphaerales bacterium]|nr:hypothetical protein [Phycisphaerales bacterium]MCK6475378.1 YIP1 family protein [Phycisphaerales bacterium]